MRDGKTPELWYPHAQLVKPALPTLGRYERGYPRGAVVHFTAGAYGLSELELARQQGWAFLLIDKDGGVHQGHPFDLWGAHAGKSSWEGLEGTVSRHLVGIEVDCAGGPLKADRGNFSSWWGAPIDRDEVRVVEASANRLAGAYHKFTEAQEQALCDLLLWLKAQAPDVFDLELVLGHDEVSPGRKQDPGGSLSVTMPAFRAHLEALWQRARRAPQAGPAA